MSKLKNSKIRRNFCSDSKNQKVRIFISKKIPTLELKSIKSEIKHQTLWTQKSISKSQIEFFIDFSLLLKCLSSHVFFFFIVLRARVFIDIADGILMCNLKTIKRWKQIYFCVQRHEKGWICSSFWVNLERFDSINLLALKSSGCVTLLSRLSFFSSIK